MDSIAQLNETDIPKTILPTAAAFQPLLEANRSQIINTPKKTFKYGATDRHQLDIYYPTTTGKRDKSPILFFVYGGGFRSGDRTNPNFDLIFGCLGSFFTQRGFIVVIADYRLIPNVVFPGPVEDIRDAMIWVLKNPERLTIPGSSTPDLDTIFVMGHSAGALITSSLFLLPDIWQSKNVQVKVAGIILASGVYHPKALDPNDQALADVVTLWGSLEEAISKTPCGLLASASPKTIQALPQIRILEGQREPSWLSVSSDDFTTLLKERTTNPVQKIVETGHNHVSLIWALGSGDLAGEKWAEDAIEWMWALVAQK